MMRYQSRPGLLYVDAMGAMRSGFRRHRCWRGGTALLIRRYDPYRSVIRVHWSQSSPFILMHTTRTTPAMSNHTIKLIHTLTILTYTFPVFPVFSVFLMFPIATNATNRDGCVAC